MDRINASDLKLGDVLLYSGTSFISKLIKMFDHSEYSHAGIYYEGSILEAIASGIEKRSLSQSIAEAEFVDVYRFKTDDGKKLRDPDYPDGPVCDRITHYFQQHDRYAYEELVLLALLETVRPIDIPVVSWILRTILDTAASILTKLIAMGKEPMICSELVYRCYNEAGAKYDLKIKGATFLKRPDTLLKTPPPKAIATSDVASIEKEYSTINSQAEMFLEKYAKSKNKMVPAPAGISGSAAMPVYEGISLKSLASSFAVADFVTPCDLKNSPSLFLVGRLK